MNMISPHPLVGSLEDMSTEDLQTKISELYRKLAMARQMSNAHLANQISMALASYNDAYTAKLKQDTDGNNFNSVIDIS